MKITFEKMIFVMVGLTILIQATILYRQEFARQLVAKPAPPVQEAPEGLTFPLSGLPTRGADSASMVLVEFSDYECPFCQRHALGVGAQIEDQLISSGKLRLAFANNPLPMHSNAVMLAVGAICAGQQNHYWEMHDRLFRESPKTKEELVAIAEDLSVNVPIFVGCLDNPESRKVVERDRGYAKKLGFTGTPSFALAYADSSGRLTIKKIIRGAQPFSVFSETITETAKYQAPQ